MAKSIRVSRKYVRKNRPPEPGFNIGVRLQQPQLDQLDSWITKQADRPSRPEAVRRLLERGLEAVSAAPASAPKPAAGAKVPSREKVHRRASQVGKR
jgi:hypothetical protein